MKSSPGPTNPLIQVLKLLIADPNLRRAFIADPSVVFSQLGLGCPADFVGRKGNLCPAMPPLPQGEAATNICDPYWRDWLQGGVEQLRNAKLVLADELPFPLRDSFATDAEWQLFVENVKADILASIEAWHKADQQS